jgi:hypothetical protein
MKKFLHMIFWKKELIGIFYSDEAKWELLGSKRSLCELVTGMYRAESDIEIKTAFCSQIKVVEKE